MHAYPWTKAARRIGGAALLGCLVWLPAPQASAADTFTINVATDQFASVHLQVRVTAAHRAGYLQEGSQYLPSPEWQYVDSLLCGQTTREIEVWADPRAARTGTPEAPAGRLYAAFAVMQGQQVIGQGRVERDISGGGNVRGFTHLVGQDFVLVINRECK
ncbi:MAG: hypothetical protein L6R19_14030 [Alphaproteobacteria bacterium]|nr:hypothetical protein [Alphaproteobacteria bacterium]